MSISSQYDPFRVLVIEDDPGWHPYIIEELVNLGIRADLAKSTDVATRLLAEKRYHYLSCDIRMPQRKGGPPKMDLGMSFTKTTSRGNGQLSLMDVFTAQVNPNIDPRRVGAIYLLAGSESLGGPFIKSYDGRDHPEQNEYSAQGWARRIAEILRDPSFPIKLLERGGESLPSPLAHKSYLLTRHWPSAAVQPAFWIVVRDFYSVVLNLVLAQLRAFLSDSGIRKQPNRIGRQSDVQKIAEIRESLIQLESTEKLSAWIPYFSDPPEVKANLERPQGYVGEGMVNTLTEWRHWRNQNAHEVMPAGWEKEISEYRNGITRLIDLAAFWARYPLISEFEFIDGKGTARVIAIRGNGSWKTEICELNTTLQSTPGHVYLRLGKGQLIDLFPWMHTEVNEVDRTSRTLYVLSGAQEKREVYFHTDVSQLKTTRWKQ